MELTLRDLSQLVVMQAQKGTSRDEIVNILVARGWPGVSAVRFVNMTLIEESGRIERPPEIGSSAPRSSAPPAQAPVTDDQQPAKENYTKGMVTWKILIVVVLVMVIAYIVVFLAFA